MCFYIEAILDRETMPKRANVQASVRYDFKPHKREIIVLWLLFGTNPWDRIQRPLDLYKSQFKGIFTCSKKNGS